MTDPTMQGTPTGTHADKFSLAELDTHCRKATRGAGYSWGLAEEAGKAVRWLAARGLPGPQALAELLKEHDGKTYTEIKPVRSESILRAANGSLCPIITGALICDHASKVHPTSTLTCMAIKWPLLILPFLAQRAKIENINLQTSWPGLEVVLGPTGISLQGSESTYLVARSEQLLIQSTPLAPSPRSDSSFSVPVPTASWRLLDHYAALTYAPATQASRLAGAGAGIVDQD